MSPWLSDVILIDADTFSGLLMHHANPIPHAGDVIDLDGFTAEVQEARDDRAVRVLVRKKESGEVAGPEPADRPRPE